jgi:uncharacterized protein DUF6152
MKSASICLLTALLVAGLLVSIQPVYAHHSGAEFDMTKTIEITGTVKEFQFKNPHTWIQVMVEDGKSQPVEWSLEWGAPNQLGRQGYRPSTFPAGAKVTMRLHPMKNGAPAGGFVAAKFPDGKTIGTWQ